MLNPVHILNQMGVITSFSVAKKVSEDDISKFFAKGKKEGKSVAELNRILREKIVSEIEEAIMHSKIPWVVASEELAKRNGDSANGHKQYARDESADYDCGS